MRILVTGGGGFVGGWAARELEQHGHTVILTDVHSASENIHPLDVTQSASIAYALERHQPDACLHLGGIAFVPVGWKDPQLVLNVNTMGTIKLLETFRTFNSKAKILVVTSAEVYGRKSSKIPLTEDLPLTPDNIYAVSKSAADQSARLLAEHHGMAIMTARPQNHIGPGQDSRFVVASFAKQVFEMANNGATQEMFVGNLDSRRDFLDVRDVVRGYRLILEEGKPGEAYNLAVGNLNRVGDILDKLCRFAGVSPTISIDENLYRPTDDPPTLDTQKIKAHTSWEPEISLDDSLRDILKAL